MRKEKTLFAQIVNFINSQPVGTTFRVRDLYSQVNERSTPWKRRHNDPNYQTRWYCGQLRHRKVLAKNKRGTWTVLAHIPDFVTSSMIYSSKDKKTIWYPDIDTAEDTVQTRTKQSVDINDLAKSFIIVEDIRGKEVYIERSKNIFEKAVILSFKIECNDNSNDIDYQIIEIKVVFEKDNEIALFKDKRNFYFSKEEVEAKLKDYLNQL